MTDAAYALYVHLKTKVCVIRSEECLILGTWYQSLASISSPGCFLTRSLRLCGETQLPGQLPGPRRKKVYRQGFKLAKAGPKRGKGCGIIDLGPIIGAM